MRRLQPSIGHELLWLLVFLAVFVFATFLFLKFLVPRHFNDRIAVMISAIVSGTAMIALRALYANRTRRA